jgi:hypothetical protein
MIHQSEAFVEHMQGFLQCGGVGEHAEPARHFPIAGAFRIADLGNGEKRSIEGMAEHGENGTTSPVVDGIIPPFAVGNAAAVEGEKLTKFGSIEVNRRASWAVLLFHPEDLSHRAPNAAM